MKGCYLTLDFFFFQAEDGIRDYKVTGVQTCALPICFMWSEAGMVAIAPPRIQQVTGSVASALTGVSASPARPLIATSVVLLVNSIAWQAASSPTLRPVLVIYTVVD